MNSGLNKFIKYFLLLLLAGTDSHISLAKNHLDTYHEANICYQKQDYSKAIVLYEQVLAQGQYAPELYYNLGNAWYKQGNIPKSILYYERALKMSPGDEDILFNLKMASLQLIDKIDPVPQIFYKRWLNSIAEALPSNVWSKLPPALLWLALLFAGVFLFGYTVRQRKTGFILLICSLVLAMFAFFFAGKSHTIMHLDKAAIVMTPSAYVKSSPDTKGNDLFIVHEGTKVLLLDELNEWKKIKLLNGSVGWLKTSEIEII